MKRNEIYYSLFELKQEKLQYVVSTHGNRVIFQDNYKARIYRDNSVRIVEYIMNTSFDIHQKINTYVIKNNLISRDQSKQEITHKLLTLLNTCQQRYYDVSIPSYSAFKRITSIGEMLDILAFMCVVIKRPQWLGTIKLLMESYNRVFNFSPALRHIIEKKTLKTEEKLKNATLSAPKHEIGAKRPNRPKGGSSPRGTESEANGSPKAKDEKKADGL